MRISDWSSDVCSSDLYGNARIVLLLPAAHFGEQRVDQRAVRSHRRFEIGVFGLQIGKHVRVLHLRIAGIAQPGVVVADGDAVVGEAVRAAFRERRWGRSEEHTSELQSLMRISYAVFCLKKKKYKDIKIHTRIQVEQSSTTV